MVLLPFEKLIVKHMMLHVSYCYFPECDFTSRWGDSHNSLGFSWKIAGKCCRHKFALFFFIFTNINNIN